MPSDAQRDVAPTTGGAIDAAGRQMLARLASDVDSPVLSRCVGVRSE